MLNNGSANIAGFKLDGGRLVELEGSQRPLRAADADPAQIAFSLDGRTLAVTERGSDSISTYAVDERGYATGPTTIESSGKTPYGFAFRADGALVVTEAFGGAVGAAAASSYALTAAGALAPVSGSVGDTRSEVCWAAVTADGRFAYVTNFGDGTVSSYQIAADGSLELRNPVAGSTRLGEKGIRDEALTRDGRYLYAIDADAQRIFAWTVGSDGELLSIGAFEGVPATVAGSPPADRMTTAQMTPEPLWHARAPAPAARTDAASPADQRPHDALPVARAAAPRVKLAQLWACGFDTVMR